MKGASLGDVILLARALLHVPASKRAEHCALVIDRCILAHAYCRRFGRVHPRWGDGSLSAAVLREGAPPAPVRMTAEFAKALVMVLQAVPLDQPEAQETQR